MKDKIIEILKDKHIAILGFGREGKTTYEFIKEKLPNNKITIIDKADVRDAILDNPNVDFVIGDNYLEDLAKYDLIMKTPGISFLGVDTSGFEDKITSQMELFLEVNRDNVIGVTGTKGKSTTVSLIHSILTAAGINNVLAGNIGTPVFTYLDEKYHNYKFVLELSSHQLEFLNTSPHIAIVLNLFQDHLDHAGNIKHYYESKMNIFKYQNENDYMLYFEDNVNLNNIVKQSNFLAKHITVSKEKEADIYLKRGVVYSNGSLVFNENLKRAILGEHNFINIMFAYKVGELLNIDSNIMLDAISEFQGLEYRMECLGIKDNISYYVDTLATIPEATLETIKSIPNVNTLIFGGMDRGISYEGFANALAASKIEHFICMPETGHMIGKELPSNKVYYVDTLEEAVAKAKEITKPNTVCLLSPAAASYKHFKNYQDKAEKYREYIFGKTS